MSTPSLWLPRTRSSFLVLLTLRTRMSERLHFLFQRGPLTGSTGCQGDAYHRRLDWIAVLLISSCNRSQPHSVCEDHDRSHLQVQPGRPRLRVSPIFCIVLRCDANADMVAGSTPISKARAATSSPTTTARTSSPSFSLSAPQLAPVSLSPPLRASPPSPAPTAPRWPTSPASPRSSTGSQS